MFHETKVSQPQHYGYFTPDNLLMWGTVPGIVGWLAASLASAH